MQYEPQIVARAFQPLSISRLYFVTPPAKEPSSADLNVLPASKRALFPNTHLQDPDFWQVQESVMTEAAALGNLSLKFVPSRRFLFEIDVRSRCLISE